MAVAFEHYGQTVATTAPPPVPTRTAQAQAEAGQATEQRTAVLWCASLFGYACTLMALGAAMVRDGSWLQLWWWQVFGWQGYVDLPLALLPLGVVLVACWVPVWLVTVLVQRVWR